jgi:hypothetical protein
MFTTEQVRRAKGTNLESWLRSHGETLRRAGNEYRWVYRDSNGEHDSVTIRGSEWYDHKRSVGGDAIGFLQEYRGMSFKSAVAALLGSGGVQSPQWLEQTAQYEQLAPKAAFTLPERNGNMRRLFAYLIQTRCIPGEIVTQFAHAGTLYEDAKHHNIVFLANDENGIARAAFLKGTNSFGESFRLTCAGSDTRYAFCHKGTSERLHVFEAPIDMLSFAAMYGADWTVHSYIALGGLSPKAMMHFLERNPQVSAVRLCLDNDEAGNACAERFTQLLMVQGCSDVQTLVPQYKDWNEDLQARAQACASQEMRTQMIMQQI